MLVGSARGLALLALLLSSCSVLLSHDASQCQRDSDCEVRGFDRYRCDVAAQVCVPSSAGSSAAGANAGSAADDAGAPSTGGGASGNGAAGNPGAGSDDAGSDGNAGSPAVGGSAGIGAAGSGTGGGSAGTAPIPEWPVLPAPASGTRIRVRSFCAQKLWLHAISAQNGSLMPDDALLETNGVVDLLAPPTWLGGQVFVYGTAARGVELHMVGASVSAGNTFFSLQYLQEFGLPSEVSAVGGTCTGSAYTRSCLAHESDVASCPESFLKDGARCLSPSVYCAQNPGEAYCHALDGAISGCNGCPAGSTLDVYAGTGNYAAPASEKLAAALNRGMSSNPDSTNSALFYQTKPYNTYAKWVHGLCPKTVAFTHDEFGSGITLYPACNATELRITLCPAR